MASAFCQAKLDPDLLPSKGRELTQYEREALWRIFQAIGSMWKNLHSSALDSANLKSSWLEFIEAKTHFEPSYVAEYSNAVLVVDELIETYCEGDRSGFSTPKGSLTGGDWEKFWKFSRPAFEKLFLDNGIPKNKPPTTRLAHAKRFVIDEFIRVNIVASGFRSFRPDKDVDAASEQAGFDGGPGRNYKGYIGGSRYNLKARVRHYEPSGKKR